MAIARASKSDKWYYMQDGSILGLVTGASLDSDKDLMETAWMNPNSESYFEPGKKTNTLSIDAFFPRVYETGQSGYKEVRTKYESDSSIAWELRSYDTSTRHSGIGWIKSCGLSLGTGSNATYKISIQVDGSVNTY